MALKKWNKASFPLSSLVDGVSDFWTASGSGTNEYYYNQSLSQVQHPSYIDIGGAKTLKSSSALGSLAAGEWGWGDNDTIGNDTVYVRLSDDADPDSKPSGHLKIGQPLEVLQAVESKETILLGALVSNYAKDEDAEAWVIHMSGSTLLMQWYISLAAGSSPLALDTKIVVDPTEQVFVLSDTESLSVYISGDET